MGEQVDLAVFLDKQVSFGFFERQRSDDEFALGQKLHQIIADIEPFESSDQLALSAVPADAADFKSSQQSSTERV